MAIPTLSTVPPAPSRADPDNFDSKGDIFLSHMEKKLQPELNATVDATNTAVAAVDNSAVVTMIAMQNATAAQQAAAASAGATPWVSGTSYALNATVISQVNFQVYRKRTNTSVSSTDPMNDGTNWVAVGTGVMPRETRTANTQLERTDTGKLIEITSGTFTQTFNTASNLGNGWFVYYKNSGSGTITTNGLAIQPGWFGIIHCTGSTFVTTAIRQATGFMRVTGKNTGESFSGPTSVSGVVITRTLNTVEDNTIPGASLAANQITLPSGSYRYNVHAPIRAAASQLRFAGVGGAQINGDGNNINTLVVTASGGFTLSTTQQVFLEQYVRSTSQTPSFVTENQMGGLVLLTEIEIEKVA